MTSAIQPQETLEREDIIFVPRCSTPFSDSCRDNDRRLLYLPDENASKICSSEYNDWKKRLQGKKSSRNFKVRGSVPGVKKLGDPNALPHPEPGKFVENCSIISGHFELELVSSRINESTITRPEPMYQMQWFQVSHPQLLTNNCLSYQAYYNGANMPYIHHPVPLHHLHHHHHQGVQYSSGTFLAHGNYYPANYYSNCVLKPQLVMCNYPPHYNYPGAGVQPVHRQMYYQYNPSAFIAYAAASARPEISPSNFYPNYAPRQSGVNSYGINPQAAFSTVMMTS